MSTTDITPPTLTDKFLQSVVVTLIARATLVCMPFVVAFISYLTLQIYGTIQVALQKQAEQIIQMQIELQDHQTRLDACKAARLELQENTEKQFARLDVQLTEIANKLASVNNTVIRVQTIVETRLPTREGSLFMPPKE